MTHGIDSDTIPGLMYRMYINWTALSRGFDVPASRVYTDEELATELQRALAEPGPYLIEAVIE